jgi:hypothetical protein
MAYLAEQLGRRFEARAYLTLAIAADPDREDLRRHLTRLDESTTLLFQDARTLADVVAREGEVVTVGPNLEKRPYRRRGQSESME